VDQERKISMKGRLSASEADPINPAFKSMETLKDVLQGDRSELAGMKDQRMVMAVRTTEVAARKKEDRADLPWPIQKRSFYESLDLDHNLGS
jgi:hypothetical protein